MSTLISQIHGLKLSGIYFKPAQILAMSILLVAPVWGDQPDPEQRADELVSGPVLDVSQVTPDVQPLVIQRLKTQLTNPDQRQSAQMGLLMLGDPDTVQKTVAEFRAGNADAGKSLEFLGNDDVLPSIVQQMLSGSTFSDVNNPRSQREQATAIALSILKRSTSVPLETSQWAEALQKRLLSGDPSSKSTVQSLMEQWWLHNGQAFAAHHGDAATWLPAQETKNSSDVSANVPSAATSAASIDTPLAADAVKSSITKPEAKTEFATTAVSDDNPTLVIVMCFVVAVGSLGVAYLLFQMLSPGNKSFAGGSFRGAQKGKAPRRR